MYCHEKTSSKPTDVDSAHTQQQFSSSVTSMQQAPRERIHARLLHMLKDIGKNCMPYHVQEKCPCVVHLYKEGLIAAAILCLNILYVLR